MSAIDLSKGGGAIRGCGLAVGFTGGLDMAIDGNTMEEKVEAARERYVPGEECLPQHTRKEGEEIGLDQANASSTRRLPHAHWVISTLS